MMQLIDSFYQPTNSLLGMGFVTSFDGIYDHLVKQLIIFLSDINVTHKSTVLTGRKILMKSCRQTQCLWMCLRVKWRRKRTCQTLLAQMTWQKYANRSIYRLCMICVLHNIQDDCFHHYNSVFSWHVFYRSLNVST